MRVIPRIDLRDRYAATLTRASLSGVLPRATLDVAAAAEQIRPVCEDVRRRGAAAVREYTARFDGVDLASTRVPREALDRAARDLDPAVAAALEEAARRARLVHQAQLPPAETVVTPAAGLTVAGRYVPVSRAGVYVPGGLVAYPSSVVMNVVPAQVAGVGSVAVASPPRADNGGLPHPAVLAACALFVVQPVVGRWLKARVTGAERGHLRVAAAGTLLGSVYGGYFGAGLGVILLALLGLTLPDDLVRTNGLRAVLSLVVNLAVAIVFLAAAHVAWPDAALLAGSSLVGGYLGARAARRLPTAVFRVLVVTLGLVTAARLLAG